MEIKKFNISKSRKYTGKDGVEKTQWNNIGMITEFYKDDGSVSRIIEIPAIGLEANIFPFVEKDKAVKNNAEANPEDTASPTAFNDDNINPSDIPF